MAVGDVVSGHSVVTTGSTLDIKPPSGQEWVIHNVYYNNAVEFNRTEGTNPFKFDSDTTFGARLGVCFHLTNSIWMQVKNVQGSNIIVSYDGIQTK